MSELLDEMKEIAEAVNQELDKLLPVPNTPESKLVEAMRYSAISKGKKMRPFLLIKSASLFILNLSCVKYPRAPKDRALSIKLCPSKFSPLRGR